MSDTSAAAAAVQLGILRRLGPARRLQLAMAMSATARVLLESRLSREHAEWPEARIRQEVLRCTLSMGESLPPGR